MSKFVVDDIEKVVCSMRKDPAGPPFFMKGQAVEIDGRQQLRLKDKEKRFLRYPLIALKTKFPQEFDGLGYKVLRLNIIILAQTDKEYNTDERYEHVIKPILYPLYECFIDRLRKSGLFIWNNLGEMPSHRMIEHPHWGTPGTQGNEKHYFADPLDAIELVDLNIKQKKYC